VEKTVFLGETIECFISAGKQMITAKVPATQEVNEGQDIFLRFSPEASLLLPAEPA
jgi:hypothetical protein